MATSRAGRACGGGTSYGMRAASIFRLARTSRCASVASGTRKARAISTEPEARMRPARIRPDSRRKTCSIVSCATSAMSGRRGRGAHAERPDLDAPFAPLARRRDLHRPLDGLVEIAAVEDVVAGEL